MKECDKIESLLWESIEKSLSREKQELLDRHLSECEKCREAQTTMAALAESRKADRDLIASVDAGDFEDAVMRKIKAQEAELRFKREDRGYMVRLYVSVGLAAAIVAFIVLSLGDLERYVMPSIPYSYRSQTPARVNDTLHITLKPRQLAELPASQPTEPAVVEEKDVMKIMPPPTIAKAPDTIEQTVTAMAEEEAAGVPEKEFSILEKEEEEGLVIVDAEPTGDIEKGLPVFRTRSKPGVEDYPAKKSEVMPDEVVGGFSILSKPVTKPAPDSVVINSIYLSDESIPMASQQTRAFLPEVIVDSGIIQTARTPRSVLVTVDKMPIPVNIVTPEYPVWARKNGISGVVWIKARVDKEGDVVSAEALSSSMPGYGFEEASLEAAKKCEYLPAEAGGFKIDISVIYPVKFIFRENEIE